MTSMLEALKLLNERETSPTAEPSPVIASNPSETSEPMEAERISTEPADSTVVAERALDGIQEVMDVVETEIAEPTIPDYLQSTVDVGFDNTSVLPERHSQLDETEQATRQSAGTSGDVAPREQREDVAGNFASKIPQAEELSGLVYESGSPSTDSNRQVDAAAPETDRTVTDGNPVAQEEVVDSPNRTMVMEGAHFKNPSRSPPPSGNNEQEVATERRTSPSATTTTGMPTLRLQENGDGATTAMIIEDQSPAFASRLSQIDEDGNISRPDAILSVEPLGISIQEALSGGGHVAPQPEACPTETNTGPINLPFNFFSGSESDSSINKLIPDNSISEPMNTVAAQQPTSTMQHEPAANGSSVPIVSHIPRHQQRVEQDAQVGAAHTPFDPNRTALLDLVREQLKIRRLATEYHAIWNSIRETPVEGPHQGNILFCDSEADRPAAQMLLYLAAVPRDGDSRSVLLLDIDFEKAALSTVLNFSNTIGFSELCLGADLEGLVQAIDLPNTYILPAGVARTDLDAESIQVAIDELSLQYDYILVSGGTFNRQVMPAANRSCGKSFLVVRLGTSDRITAIDAVNSLHLAGVELGGCIVANIDADCTNLV